MQCSSRFPVHLSPHEIWAALHEPAALKASIPRCESVTDEGAGRFDFRVAQKIAPLVGPAKGRLIYDAADEGRVLRCKASGSLAMASFSGMATITIDPARAGSDVNVALDMEIPAIFARFFGGMLEEKLKLELKRFFNRLAQSRRLAA